MPFCHKNTSIFRGRCSNLLYIAIFIYFYFLRDFCCFGIHVRNGLVFMERRFSPHYFSIVYLPSCCRFTFEAARFRGDGFCFASKDRGEDGALRFGCYTRDFVITSTLPPTTEYHLQINIVEPLAIFQRVPGHSRGNRHHPSVRGTRRHAAA